jgi:hypothetical protein
MATSRSIWPVMSRFARLQSGPISTWSPPESPFRVEYPPALLREVRISSGGVDAFGVLYGVRHGKTIRLVATRGRAGLEPLGVFASRVRGKVFLTEKDLERFDKAEASVAMVISGDTGGFFVRDSAGAIETVRSYQEFSAKGTREPVAVRKPRWPWAACLLLIPLLFLRPHPPQLALTVREAEGQVRISWNVPTAETLTILDGGERTYIPIAPEESTATYARRSGDVTVGIGSAKARFVGLALPPNEIERARAGVETLRQKLNSLRAEKASGETRIAALERRLQ